MSPYVEQKILASTPLELICLLYRHATRCIRDAREHLVARRIAERSRSIEKAWAVLAELACSIQADERGCVGSNLLDLYAYMQGQLVYANLHQVDAPLAEVLGLLSTLLEAWETVTLQSSGSLGGNTHWAPGKVATSNGHAFRA